MVVMNQFPLEVQLTDDLKTIKVQVYVHGAPTVIDYNLALNRFFRLKKFRSGHPDMQELFNPPVHIWQFKPWFYSFILAPAEVYIGSLVIVFVHGILSIFRIHRFSND